MKTLSDKVEELQQEMAMLEPVYERAKARVEGRDKEWNEKKPQLIRQIVDLLAKFTIGDEPHKAVAIVAQASILGNELRMPEHWVAVYEEKQKILKLAQRDRERIEASENAAREAASRQSWNRAVGV